MGRRNKKESREEGGRLKAETRLYRYPEGRGEKLKALHPVTGPFCVENIGSNPGSPLPAAEFSIHLQKKPVIFLCLTIKGELSI